MLLDSPGCAQVRYRAVQFSDLRIGASPVVGRGHFGVVVKAEWNSTPVALKSGVDDVEYLLQASIPPHDNVVQALGMCKDFSTSGSAADLGRDGPRLVMELCAEGTVKSLLQATPVRVF